MTRNRINLAHFFLRVFTTLAILLLWAALGTAQTARGGQRSFLTPNAAAKALLTAAETNNTTALVRLLGPGSKEIVDSGDPVQDRDRRATFTERARQRMKVDAGPRRAIIVIGDDRFPFPIPLIKSGSRWRFDLQHGRRELLARRIGSNELDAIDLAAAYVEAQDQFATTDPENSGVHQYAQRFISSPDTKDGLYWPADEGEDVSPIASLVREAEAEGYDVSGANPVPYHGYHFRILNGQGPRAAGGARDYVVRGMMLGGFGLVAWPAEYGASGIKTFLVNQDGVVYEKDLGTQTADAAAAIRTFNPDPSWKAVK